MAISKNLVQNYQDEYRRKFGESISSKEAEKELFDLSTLIRFIRKERRQRNVR